MQAQLQLCQIPAGRPGALSFPVAMCVSLQGWVCRGDQHSKDEQRGNRVSHFSILSSAGFATHALWIHRFESKPSSAKAVTSTIMVVVLSALKPTNSCRGLL